MFISSKDVLGIEIGSQFLRMIHITGSGEILHWIAVDIGGWEDAAISGYIKNFVAEKKIESVDVVNHVSAGNTITKNIELPATSADEIQKIIKLQAGHYSPYSAEEIIIEYLPLGVFREGYTRVFLMIVKRDSISRSGTIIGNAGLALTKTVLSLETLEMWYKDKAGAPLGVLHLDSDITDFMVIHKGKPLFLRNIPIGMGQVAYDREKYLPYLIEEIGHSLDAYQAEQAEPLAKLIVTGATAKIADALNTVQETHSIQIEVEDNFRELKLSPELEAVKDALADTSVVSLAASALQYGKAAIDLTPEEVKHKASAAAKSRDLVWLSALLFVILALWAAMLVQKMMMKDIILTRLQEESAKYSSEAKELKESQRKLQVVRKYFSHRTFALEALNEIYDKCITASEYGIYLKGINFNDDKQPRIVVRGIAGTNEDVLKAVDRLEKSPLFTNVKLNFANSLKEVDKTKGVTTEVVDFEILCGFE